MAGELTVADSPEALAERVASDFAAHVQETLARQPRFAVALAGGLTPRLFYERLAQEPTRGGIAWDRLWFFWGDERCVPPDHPDSNFRMASEALLSRVPALPSHVQRLRGEDPPPQAARDYEKALREFFRAEPAWPAFDLVLLGLGPDGHTASLMPGSPAVAEAPAEGPAEERRQAEAAAAPRWVVHNVIRSLQTVRLTLTLPAINHARQAWFLVTGAKKRAAFVRARQAPDPACPASLIRPERGELRWYVDKAVVTDA